MAELKACPFCGSNAYTTSSEDEIRWRVACVACGASTDEFRNKGTAIEMWNQRNTATLTGCCCYECQFSESCSIQERLRDSFAASGRKNQKLSCSFGARREGL